MSKGERAGMYLILFAITVWMNQLIWNNIIVEELFTSLPKVTYFQSFCIYLLTNSLFNARYYTDIIYKD